MAVKNILDFTFILDGSTEPVYKSVNLTITGNSPNNIQSYYVMNGNLCVLLIPAFNLNPSSSGNFTITVPSNLIPAETKIVYDFDYRVDYVYESVAPAVLSLTSGSNTMTLSAIDPTLFTPIIFPNDTINTQRVYIAYLTN